MARILTGIQSTGIPHLGNLLGAIIPAIALSENENNESYFFIADLHSLTTIFDAELRQKYVHSLTAAWLAFGLNVEKNVFFRQSDIREVTELTWYLSCFTPYPMLANAHSFKDKSDRLSDVNAGLFNYPVLMAADILLYDANLVPVGKDQLQHLEITRDIAGKFNNSRGETFVIPEARISEEVMIVPGIDGQKMSKSYNNFIDIFQSDKALRKTIMQIVTDSTPLEDPKDPETCNVFNLYRLIADKSDTEALAAKYRAGNFGYGHAKQALFELIVETYADQRKRYNELMQDKAYLETVLESGAQKAGAVAEEVISRVRQRLGF